MTTDTIQAWILHKRWSGDTSAQITFFTREHGVLSCLYKGGRTAKKQVALQPFLPLWLAVNERGGWYYVRQLEISAPAYPLFGDALFSALYVNELVYHALKPNDAHASLFDAYQVCLKALVDSKSRTQVEPVLRRFEWSLLKDCGYQMDLNHDRHFEPIESDSTYQYIPGEGFEIATNGILGRHILAFSADQLDNVDVLKAVKRVMRQAIHHFLDGRPIKARALFER